MKPTTFDYPILVSQASVLKADSERLLHPAGSGAAGADAVYLELVGAPSRWLERAALLCAKQEQNDPPFKSGHIFHSAKLTLDEPHPNDFQTSRFAVI